MEYLRSEHEQCGKSQYESRIVGGKPAIAHTQPWVVRFTWVFDMIESTFCGGTLIGRRHVLSAAHCIVKIRNGSIQVFKTPVLQYAILGEHNIKVSDGEIKYKILLWFNHPNFLEVKARYGGRYGDKAFVNDFAIAELLRDVEYNDKIKPICLPPLNSNYVGKNVIVSGWGYTTEDGLLPDELMTVDVLVLPADECKVAWRREWGKIAYDANAMFCAANKPLWTKDSCYGDSGGVNGSIFKSLYKTI